MAKGQEAKDNLIKKILNGTAGSDYIGEYDKKHYFWLDEYQSLPSSEIDEYVNYKNTTNAKQIICITTGKIFKSTTYASQCYNIKTTYNILKCCKNMPKNKHCGKLSDGTRLKWMYYEDFLKLPQEE